MKKSGRLSLFLVVVFMLLAVFLFSSQSLAFGITNVGNSSDSLQNRYGGNDNLSGWINFSVSNEPFNSVISASYLPYANSSTITLMDLLIKNRILNYNCSTFDCNMTYAVSGSGSDSLTFILNAGESKLLGFNIVEPSVDSINDFRLNFSSTATPSCISQLRFDLGDDGSIDWSANAPKLDNSNCSQSYGCYTPSTLTTLLPQTTEFCEDINVSSAARLYVGADLARVTGSSSSNFKFRIDDKECNVLGVSDSGKIGCLINKTITEPTTLSVCLSQTSANINNFALYREITAPTCGTDGNDFSIFLQTIKFDSFENIIVNSSALTAAADNSLDNYAGNCLSGCYIPLRIYSTQDGQQITIHNAQLIYKSGAITSPLTTLYNLISAPSKITFPFTRLYLNNSGLTAPGYSGIYNLSLKFNDQLITKKQIEVLSLPIISDLSPTQVPAALDSLFTIGIAGTNVTNYVWSFGDNSTAQTTINSVTHRYSALGRYNLIVTATNAYGSKSQAFSVNVVSPNLYLNSTISNYKQKITFLKNQIASFPDSVKNYIDQKLNLTGLEILLTGFQVEYNSVGNNSQKYIEIANALQNINLPFGINITEQSVGKLLFSSEKVNPDIIKNITDETTSVNDDILKAAVSSWAADSLDLSASLKVYSTITQNSSQPLVSYISLTIAPKTSLSNVYLIITLPRSSVTLENTADAIYLDNALAVPLDLSSGAKNINFLLPDRTTFLTMPAFISPKLSELNIISEFGPCNFNNICETGETSSNCRNDCKPVGLTLFWLGLSLLLILCVYIGLQEWYKKRYESYLFKDSNDLYNLTNFIDNAEKQALKRDEIFRKLGEKGWSNEQIEYAYKKYKGQRTGMWEIPIFKFAENKKVAQELALRKNLGINPGIPPRPISSFAKTNRPVFPQKSMPGNKMPDNVKPK
jgi:PKD repeat protein